jgi:hypothetical protein
LIRISSLGLGGAESAADEGRERNVGVSLSGSDCRGVVSPLRFGLERTVRGTGGFAKPAVVSLRRRVGPLEANWLWEAEARRRLVLLLFGAPPTSDSRDWTFRMPRGLGSGSREAGRGSPLCLEAAAVSSILEPEH